MWGIVVPASLAIIIFLVLLVPIDIAFHTYVPGKPKFSLRLAWLFGLVSREITGREKPEEKKKVVKGRKKPGRKINRVKNIFELLRIKGLLMQVSVLVRRIIGCFKIKELSADFKVGLGDPADTGMLFAAIGPAALLSGSTFPCQIRIEPSFQSETTFTGRLNGTVRLQPIKLVVPLIRFVFSLATIRVIQKLVLTRWKRKK